MCLIHPPDKIPLANVSIKAASNQGTNIILVLPDRATAKIAISGAEMLLVLSRANTPRAIEYAKYLIWGNKMLEIFDQ